MIAKFMFGCLFIVAGFGHFGFTGAYQRIVPPVFPQPRLIVLISGVAEILLGAALLVPVTTRLAGWGLIVLLVAVFPANVYMALHPELFPRIPVWTLWVRLPLQAALIAWAYLYAKA